MWYFKTKKKKNKIQNIECQIDKAEQAIAFAMKKCNGSQRDFKSCEDSDRFHSFEGAPT